MSDYIFLFDLDATISKVEILPEIARKIHKEEEMRVLTERTMQGEIPFEKSFLRNMRKIIKKNPGKAINIHFRELWDSIYQYRNDGIWNDKNKTLLFPLSEKMTFDYENEHHIPWIYRELNDIVSLDYNLYHLKMVQKEDREKRKDLYNKLDPNKVMLAIGYDYLVNTEDLSLEKIKFKDRYDYKTVPSYYKD